ILPALTSVFLFDAPGSEKNPATIVLFWSALSFPLACLLSVVSSWILYQCDRFTAAGWAALVPILNVAGGGAALLWLELFNGGRFS
ncbi:MAG: hypothetical protein M3Z22_07825, partial [Verrucomicrobiota bacterium]|nr:hypothetical protein [Verrucomicrobiota bacterium]